MCRGNFRSSWAAEGGYDFVAEALFGELAVDGFFLEYDDERSGGFEPLRFVPPGKQVVLGPGDHQAPAARDKDTLKRRIEEAAAYVPLDQLCLSPQCGFSSTVEGNQLGYDDQVAKLRAHRRGGRGGLGPSAQPPGGRLEVVEPLGVVDEDPVPGGLVGGEVGQQVDEVAVVGHVAHVGMGPVGAPQRAVGGGGDERPGEGDHVVVGRRPAGRQPLGAGDLDPAAVVAEQPSRARNGSWSSPAAASTRAMWSMTYGHGMRASSPA